jgi:hypothetical protein
MLQPSPHVVSEGIQGLHPFPRQLSGSLRRSNESNVAMLGHVWMQSHDSAKLRTCVAWFGQVLEAAFKNETVGLVTRDEFVNKRNTLQRRIEEQALQQKRAAEDSAARVFPKRRIPLHGKPETGHLPRSLVACLATYT